MHDKAKQNKASFAPGMELTEGRRDSGEPVRRKQWSAAAPDSVLQALAGASLTSSDSVASTGRTLTGNAHGSAAAVLRSSLAGNVRKS